MRLGLLLALLSGVGPAVRGAAVCNPDELQGAYGFLLTGDATISGSPKPAASLGLLVFDGSGHVSGTSSVKYAGVLLGNSVTGTYTAGTDCAVSWSLQDDSGGYQHFSGTATPHERRVDFRQTDPGGAKAGVLVRTAGQACEVSDLRAKYDFTMSGTMTPVTQGGPSGAVSIKGVMAEDSHHNFQLALEGKQAFSTQPDISVDSDCTVHLSFALPAEGDQAAGTVNLRGMLVGGGKQILAIQTDPGAVVSAKFTAR